MNVCVFVCGSAVGLTCMRGTQLHCATRPAMMMRSLDPSSAHTQRTHISAVPLRARLDPSLHTRMRTHISAVSLRARLDPSSGRRNCRDGRRLAIEIVEMAVEVLLHIEVIEMAAKVVLWM